jgi:hypothetical protein
MKRRTSNKSVTWSRRGRNKRLNRSTDSEVVNVSSSSPPTGSPKNRDGTSRNNESHTVSLSPSSLTNNYNYSTFGALIVSLDVPLLTEVVKFMGPHQFRFVAGINRRFRTAYLLAHTYNTTTYINVSTPAHANISYREVGSTLAYNATKQQIKLWTNAVQQHGIQPSFRNLKSFRGGKRDWKQVSTTEQNHLAFLQWLMVHGFSGDKHTCKVATILGHLHVLEWARGYNFPWGSEICYSAAIYRRWDALKWVHKNGCPWDEATCEEIARTGNLSMLKWARDNGCPWDCKVCTAAAGMGNLSLLQWVRENGCEWDESTCSSASSLDILKWARENGCPWNESTCSAAAVVGDLRKLQYAQENYCPWDHRTCASAARYGKLTILQWARENGCPWNEDTCAAAAAGGHLDLLQWSRNNGCDWDESTSFNAAKNGHLDVLQWARENGCAWSMYTCSIAAQYGQFDVLRWAHSNHCPISSQDVFSQATRGNHLQIIQWIKEKYYALSGPLLTDMILKFKHF